MQEGTFTKAIYQRMKIKKLLGTYKYAGRHFYLGNLLFVQLSLYIISTCDMKDMDRIFLTGIKQIFAYTYGSIIYIFTIMRLLYLGQKYYLECGALYSPVIGML